MEDLVRIRYQDVEGVAEWVWPIADEGAWIGPGQEFGLIRDSMKTTLRDRKLIVQAGGCCGMYPRLFSEIFDTVVTFEPAPLNWYCLNRNCPSDRIIKYNAAVGEFEQKVWMTIAPFSNVGTNTIVGEGDGIEINQMTIDSLNLLACDAIQLDIEGYEPSALLGAAQTIARYRPVISLETKDKRDASHALLESWGYMISGETTNDTQFSPIEVP